MPWEGNADPEYMADVSRFFEVTRGHVLICGPKTFASIPDFVHADRTTFELRSWMRPAEVLARFPYFAFVNYTTLGHGDVVPVGRWRLLGPMAAMNGALLFGWSTAVIFEVLRQAMRSRDRGGRP
jgi:Ion channel